MDQRDQDLLDRQVGHLNLPRHDGVVALTIAAVFFAGMTLGSLLFAHETERMQIASNDAVISLLNGVPPPIRQ